MKNWYQSKTIWLGIINTCAGIAAFIGANPKIGIALTINGVLIIIARNLSSAPIGTPADTQ